MKALSNKTLQWLLICILGLVWLPFLLLSFYNVPIGMHEWEWMTGNAGSLPPDWWSRQVYLYTQIMGRYTSNALLSLTDIWCSLPVFPVFFFCWHLFFFIMLWFCIRSVCGGFKARSMLLITIFIQTLFLAYLHDIYDTMYRYTGILTYQLGSVFVLLLIPLVLKYQRRSKLSFVHVLFVTILLIAASGTNEITMLLVLISSLVWSIDSYLKQKNIPPILYANTIIAIICACIVMCTPANSARIAGEGGQLDLIKGIGLVAGTTLYCWIDWISSGILIPMIIIAFPFVLKHQHQFSGLSLFRSISPWLWVLVLFVPASMLLTVFGTSGLGFPERVIDHIFFYVILLLFGLLISITVNLARHEQVIAVFQQKWIRMSYTLLTVFVVLHVFGNGMKVDRSKKSEDTSYFSLLQSEANATRAWLTLLSGDAAQYSNESIASLNTLYGCQTDTCFVKKPNVLPSVLYDPLSDRRNRKGDAYMGYYFKPDIRYVRYQ